MRAFAHPFMHAWREGGMDVRMYICNMLQLCKPTATTKIQVPAAATRQTHKAGQQDDKIADWLSFFLSNIKTILLCNSHPLSTTWIPWPCLSCWYQDVFGRDWKDWQNSGYPCLLIVLIFGGKIVDDCAPPAKKNTPMMHNAHIELTLSSHGFHIEFTESVCNVSAMCLHCSSMRNHSGTIYHLQVRPSSPDSMPRHEITNWPREVKISRSQRPPNT